MNVAGGFVRGGGGELRPIIAGRLGGKWGGMPASDVKNRLCLIDQEVSLSVGLELENSEDLPCRNLPGTI
jgi:hypothetical protein